jgi:hypothetical protein
MRSFKPSSPAALAAKGLNVRRNAEQIAALEKQLGLPASAFEGRLSLSKARLDILREMVGQLPSVAPVAPAPAPAPAAEAVIAAAKAAIAPAVAAPVAAVVAAALPAAAQAPQILHTSLAEFRKMDSATRLQFSQDGGALAQTDFEQLSALAKMQHCRAGGKILESTDPSNRVVAPGRVPVTPHP